MYVGYITLLGKLDKFSGKNTRLSKILIEAKKKDIYSFRFSF